MDASHETNHPTPSPESWAASALVWDQLRGVAYNAARARVRNNADAIELAQSAMLEVWRMRARVANFASALALSARIARARGIDLARRRAIERRALARYAQRTRDD